VQTRDEDDGTTPLHHVCWNGDQDIVVCLLQNGANPNARNNEGSTGQSGGAIWKWLAFSSPAALTPVQPRMWERLGILGLPSCLPSSRLRVPHMSTPPSQSTLGSRLRYVSCCSLLVHPRLQRTGAVRRHCRFDARAFFHFGGSNCACGISHRHPP